jgi:predicted transcriptional regulator
MTRPWTRKEESRLLGMVDRGVKQLVVARILGRTQTAVWLKLRKLRAAAGEPREPRRQPGDLARGGE